MANDTLNQIAKIIVTNGERSSSDSDSSVFDLSELSLVVENRDGKAHPTALSFTSFGMELTKFANGEIQVLEDDDEAGVNAFVLEDENYVEQVNLNLERRLGALQALGL